VIEKRQRRRSDHLVITLQIATMLLALSALAVTVILFETSRTASRRQTCELLRGVVIIATPPARQSHARRFLAETPLSDCDAYAHSRPFKNGRYQ
jgi:hypothetical protein